MSPTPAALQQGRVRRAGRGRHPDRPAHLFRQDDRGLPSAGRIPEGRKFYPGRARRDPAARESHEFREARRRCRSRPRRGRKACRRASESPKNSDRNRGCRAEIGCGGIHSKETFLRHSNLFNARIFGELLPADAAALRSVIRSPRRDDEAAAGAASQAGSQMPRFAPGAALQFGPGSSQNHRPRGGGSCGSSVYSSRA